MSTILLKTKLHIPHNRTTQVFRIRLIERLNQGHQGKVTLVSAPAGFGKTTLISSWIKETRTPTAWFSVDKDDNNPVQFWIYIVNALQTIHPQVGDDFLAIITSSQSAPNEALVGNLINEIEECQTQFSLVLDDFHLIENQQVQMMLQFLLNYFPQNMHLIISSRADPPWPLARMRSLHELTEIRANDLRFTFEETKSLLTEIMGLEVSKEDIARLENRTEGWIVGLQMAALSMQNRKDITGFIQAFTGTHRFILDYLLEEVLNQQVLEIQEFLLKTSILGRLTGPLCDSVLQSSNSHMNLIQLEQDNLFLIPLDDKRTWYRYHQLFSELLRSQLNLFYPDEVPALHQRASQWYEDQEYAEEAIEHAFAAHDHERAAWLCEKYAQGMLQQSRHKILSTWIETLPADLIYQRPWLCVYQSWTRHWAGMREEGEACLENAARMLENVTFMKEEEKKKLGGSIATVRAHYALVNEQLPLAIEQAEKALSLLPDNDFYTPGTAGIALGGAYWGQGEILQAENAFAACAATAMKGGFVYRASSALCYVGVQQVMQAKLKEAENTFNQALALSRGPGKQQNPMSGYPLAKLSELACEWNHLDQANELAEDGVKLCKLLGHVDLIAEAFAALARVRLERADYTGLQQVLNQADQLSMETKLDPWAITWLNDCRIRFWLSTGKLNWATDWMETSGLDVDSEFSFHHDLPHVLLARILVAQITTNKYNTDPNPCLELLSRLLATTSERGWLHHKIQILILQAHALQSIQQHDRALEALHLATTLAAPAEYIRTFIREGPTILELLQKLTEQSGTHSYREKLLQAYAKETFKLQPGLVEPLSPRELEILSFLTTSLSVPEIANELTISSNTVRSHIKNIYGKLAVNRRLDAIERAKELKLV